MKVSIIIPTLNAEKDLKMNIELLKKYNKREGFEVIIVDSESLDNTVKLARDSEFEVLNIKKSEFNHGGTRNLAVNKSKGSIIVFLTQDAILKDENSIDNLIRPLIENKDIGMSYGRQLPHLNAKVMGAFARIHNYPEISSVKSIKEKEVYGIKTVFCSNSFSAYNTKVFQEVGMFPNNVILSEDTYVCSKMLKRNYKVAYVGDACVYHSHDYTIKEEFKRYFDIGVFYGRESWILEEFSKAEKEGITFVIEQGKYLLKNKNGHLILELVVRNAMKYLGYRLGLSEKKIPISFKRKLSMHKGYWR